MAESLLTGQTWLLMGASGKIGLEIRKAALALAPGVRRICTSRQPWQGEVLPGEEWRVWDPLTDVWEFGVQVDVVVNAVGAIQETKEMRFERVHGECVTRLLHARAALGAPRIVQVSALGARDDHPTAFLRTKAQADALLLAEPDTVVLRPSIVCTEATMLSQKLGLLLRLSRFGLGKLLVPSGFAATRIQPILGSDVGQAVVQAALAPPAHRVLELVGPQPVAMGDLLAAMAAAQGRSLRLLEVPRDIMESFVKHFVAVWMPDLLNLEQFQLLFIDNVGTVEDTAALLGRLPRDTMDFWKAEAARMGDAKPAAPSLGLAEA